MESKCLLALLALLAPGGAWTSSLVTEGAAAPGK